MKIHKFDTQQKVLIVAEIGNNHEGSFDVARTLIEKTSNSNSDANAIKFQLNSGKSEFRNIQPAKGL